MFKWNDTFASESSQYFTLLPLQKFAKEHKNDYLRTNLGRSSLINAIKQFANESRDNEEVVNNWIDTTMREGRREIIIQKYDNNPIAKQNLQNDAYIYENLERLIANKDNRHVNGNAFTGEYRLVNYKITTGPLGRMISLLLCKLVYCTDGKRINEKISVQVFPVVVDFLVDRGYVLSRVKTKANMFQYDKKTSDVKRLKTTSTEREAFACIAKCLQYLQINFAEDNMENFKHQLYLLVDSCTHTPKEIVELLEESRETIDSIVEVVMANVCKLDEDYRRDVSWDVSNMVEKYFSMTYPDKRVFTKDRVAYPIKLDATDQQESKVQQIAAFEEPLQAKDIFFDNKKMLQKNRKCDSVRISYERQDSTYCKDRFSVQIAVKPRCCSIKFFDYTIEGDIENVLCSIIGDEGIDG